MSQHEQPPAFILDIVSVQTSSDRHTHTVKQLPEHRCESETSCMRPTIKRPLIQVDHYLLLINCDIPQVIKHLGPAFFSKLNIGPPD